MNAPRMPLMLIRRILTGLMFLTSTLPIAVGQSFVESAATLGITGGYGIAAGSGAGGVSFVDFNNDGWDDLTFCTANLTALKIYKNVNGTFQLVTFPGITGVNEKKTVQWIDFDNDGDQDLYIVFKPQANKLFRNNGDMTFTDITASAGLPTYSDPSQWQPNNSASFCDYDHDGDLDFYLCRYWMPVCPVDTNSFYRNNGDGTFTNITAITGTANGMRQSFCATFFDYDNDGWEDLYVVNDRPAYPNSLYKNNGDGTFTDVSDESGSDVAQDAMNGGIGDYDHNGYLDIYVTNSGSLNNLGPNLLYANQGDGTFIDLGDTSGTALDRYSWGANFFDYDHDLDLDLYVSSGTFGYATPNAFFVNQGDGTFIEPLVNSGGLAGIDTAESYTNVIGDINNDGLYDIAVCNDQYFNFQLWKNTTVNANHWFKLKLIGTQANRDAIGTWIELWVGGEKYIRSIQSQEAYCGQNSRRLIMSTGTHATIDSLVILWPIKVGNSPRHKQVVPGSQIAMQALNTITEPVICKTVLSPLNTGLGSLRAAIECAQSGDTITIALNPGDTIVLDTPIVITKNLVIKSIDSVKRSIVTPSGTPAFIVQSGKTGVFNTCYFSGSGVIIENHGTVSFQAVDMKRTAGNSSPLVMNFGQAEMHGTVQIKK